MPSPICVCAVSLSAPLRRVNININVDVAHSGPIAKPESEGRRLLDKAV